MKRHGNGSAARALLAGTFVFAVLCFASVGLAQTNARQYDIDIGPLPLPQALQLFSDQTGLQHGYIPADDEEERLLVSPLKGRYTAADTLVKLLPAGFTFEWVNPRTISIVSPPTSVPPGGAKEGIAAKDQQRSEPSKEQRLSMAYGRQKRLGARSVCVRLEVTRRGQTHLRQCLRQPRPRSSRDSLRS